MPLPKVDSVISSSTPDHYEEFLQDHPKEIAHVYLKETGDGTGCAHIKAKELGINEEPYLQTAADAANAIAVAILLNRGANPNNTTIQATASSQVKNILAFFTCKTEEEKVHLLDHWYEFYSLHDEAKWELLSSALKEGETKCLEKLLEKEVNILDFRDVNTLFQISEKIEGHTWLMEKGKIPLHHKSFLVNYRDRSTLKEFIIQWENISKPKGRTAAQDLLISGAFFGISNLCKDLIESEDISCISKPFYTTLFHKKSTILSDIKLQIASCFFEKTQNITGLEYEMLIPVVCQCDDTTIIKNALPLLMRIDDVSEKSVLDYLLNHAIFHFGQGCYLEAYKRFIDLGANIKNQTHLELLEFKNYLGYEREFSQEVYDFIFYFLDHGAKCDVPFLHYPSIVHYFCRGIMNSKPTRREKCYEGLVRLLKFHPSLKLKSKYDKKSPIEYLKPPIGNEWQEKAYRLLQNYSGNHFNKRATVIPA